MPEASKPLAGQVAVENWRDAIPKARGFEESETPCYVGRVVVALAADPHVHAKTRQVLASWTLAKEYDFCDVDGRKPDRRAYVVRTVSDILDRGNPTDGGDRFWVTLWHIQLKHDSRFQDMIRRIEDVVDL